MNDAECPCGEMADTDVRVVWADGLPSTYRYCAECAAGVVYAIEGAEILR